MRNILELPDDYVVRLSAILAPEGPWPGSRSTWYAYRKAGKTPPPVKIGNRIVGYRVGGIKKMLTANGEVR